MSISTMAKGKIATKGIKKEVKKTGTKNAKKTTKKTPKKTSKDNNNMSDKPKLTLAGQNWVEGPCCIATTLSGKPCSGLKKYPYVPYCVDCMKNGDPSLGVVQHPRFGKMLIAKRSLPGGYKFGLWGTLMREEDMDRKDDEWGFETHHGLMINPVKHKGSILQFSQCPGPHERTSITFANPYLYIDPVAEESGGKNITKESKYATMMFKTMMKLPKNNQLNMMYAGSDKESDEFFAERGLTRCDVYTPKYPTLLRKNVKVKQLLTCPKNALSKREAREVLMKKGKLS